MWWHPICFYGECKLNIGLSLAWRTIPEGHKGARKSPWKLASPIMLTCTPGHTCPSIWVSFYILCLLVYVPLFLILSFSFYVPFIYFLFFLLLSPRVQSAHSMNQSLFSVFPCMCWIASRFSVLREYKRNTSASFPLVSTLICLFYFQGHIYCLLCFNRKERVTHSWPKQNIIQNVIRLLRKFKSRGKFNRPWRLYPVSTVTKRTSK